METIITPRRRLFDLNLREVRYYKDLFYYFAWRDIKVRYKQTVVGALWAVLVPLVTMIIFSVFFGYFAGISASGEPYPIFVYIGLLLWTFFSQAITNASNSLVASQDIVKKIYFPRLLLPASSIVITFLDFCIATILLVIMSLYYRLSPDPLSIVMLPVIVLVTAVTGLGSGIFLAALNVRYRDVRYLVGFLLQILLFVTPVIYPTSIVPEAYRWALYLNPMTGVVEMARALLFDHAVLPWAGFAVSVLISVGFSILGLLYFKRTEHTFADVI